MLDVTSSTGSRIRDSRKALAMSQKAFAARLGTTRRRVIAWEGGENVPAPLYLQRLAAATGHSIEFFLDGSEADSVDEEIASVLYDGRDVLQALHAALGDALNARRPQRAKVEA